MFGIKPTFWPTVMTVPALIVLLGLGTWQVQRLFWKLEIIQTIEARSQQPAIPLPPNDAIDPVALEYRKVAVAGRFLHERELHVLAPNRQGTHGFHVFTPLERADGGVILVSRGWVPPEAKEPSARPGSQPEGRQQIEGYVRLPWSRGWVGPENDVARNMWFAVDPGAMGAAIGQSLPPVYVEAGPTPRGSLPAGGQTRLAIRNDHLQYAITWYSFAVILIVVYIVYHRRAGTREKP